MNTQFLLILGVFFLSNQDTKEIHTIKNYITSIDIDPIYTERKINLARKITPLLPIEYIPSFEQGIIYTSSILKILDIKSLFKDTNEITTTSIVVKDNKDRLNKIMGILQEESSSKDFANMGIVMNILSNLDKYKNILDIFMKLNNDKNGNKSNDNLLDVAQSLFGNQKNEKEAKEMKNMIEIISLLNSPNSVSKTNMEDKE